MEPRRPLWLTASRLAWCGASGLGLVSLLGFAERAHWVFGCLAHFRAQYAVFALLLTGATVLVGRRRLFIATSLMLALLNAAPLLPYVAGAPPPVSTGRPGVSLLVWNTWRRNDDAARVCAAIRRADADVVVLQETTEAVRAGLVSIGDRYRVLMVGDEVALVRKGTPHTVSPVREAAWSGFLVELDLAESWVDVLATHLRAPTSSAAAARRVE